MNSENLQNAPDLQTLAGLPAYEPDRQCTDRIRARCHARIAGRKRTEAVPSRAAAGHWRRILEPSFVIVVCTVFLCEVMRRALSLYGF